MDLLLKLILLFGIPAGFLYLLLQMRNKREKTLIKKFKNLNLPEKYEHLLIKFVPYQKLTEKEKKSFHWKFLYFLDDKIFNSVGNLTITEEMKVWVAAEATLMIVNLDSEVYPGLKNIYISQDSFIPKDNPINPETGLPIHTPRLGEAWKSGPIVLSWEAIEQGSSVIFHEFSHQIDQQDGAFDGTPKLGKNGNYDKWAEVMGEAFLLLRERVNSHHRTDIDSYGATNEAEFFAVLTEYYFTKATMLQNKHPEIYKLYDSYFKLNPLRWS